MWKVWKVWTHDVTAKYFTHATTLLELGDCGFVFFEQGGAVDVRDESSGGHVGDAFDEGEVWVGLQHGPTAALHDVAGASHTHGAEDGANDVA